ncbi:MAG TPA: efflux RND transporter permease subunit [Steroidobacteraceae bacterium]|nr:efflux RND transporter permease subunit [Steroidobacteraceae bacterium]
MIHTDFALRRPVTTVMVFAAIAAIGAISAVLLPLEELPDITFPGMNIVIPYPGSTPEEIEREITRPVEEALATLSGIERIRSTTRDDQVEFDLSFGWTTDAETAAFEVRTKLDAIRGQLPPGADRMVIRSGSTADRAILTVRISADRDLSDGYDLLDRSLKKRIERLDGVSRVDLYGVEPREVRILVDADRVAAYGVDLARLRALLERSNFSVSAGLLTENGRRFSVRPLGEYRSLEDVRSLVVNDTGLRLGDIASVELATPERNYVRHLNMTYAVGLDVYKTTDANMVDVAERTLREIDAARKLPEMQGISIFVLEDQATSIRSSLRDLRNSGLIGGALAFVVLLVFLRHVPTTLVVALAVPLSLLVTLSALYFLDLSINILTMMGMMLAVGMLVDNAVVVTESIYRYRQMMPDQPVRATLDGVREVGTAVMAGTATTVIVFLPIVFGEKSEATIFLGHVAVTVVVAMLASLVVAQTIIPMLAARLPPPAPSRPGSVLSRLADAYERALRASLRRPGWSALGVVLLLGSIAVPVALVKFDPFPQDAGRTVFMNYHIEGTHPLDRVEAAVGVIERFLDDNRERFEIDSIYSYLDSGRAQSSIKLVDKEHATRPTREIMDEILEEMPEIIIGRPSFQWDQQGGGEGFTLQISGDSTEQLAEVAEDLVRVLRSVEGLEGVRSDARAGEQEVQVIVDRERALLLGLSTEDVATAVAVAMRGDRLREYRATDREIRMRLAFRPSDRQSVEDLARLPLYAASGERVSLGSVATFRLQEGPRAIERMNRLTAVQISAGLAKETTLAEMKERVEPLLEQYAFPPGFTWKFVSGFETADKTQQIMVQNILLGVAIIVLVMAALFESTLLPLSIVSSIVFSIVGVYWFFLLTGTTMTFMSMVGIMVLIGVVVNIGIVLVDHINNLRQQGLSRDEAIVQAGRDRLRPILMTALTTLLGLAPLAIGDAQVGGGGNGPAYYPMARAIIGGLGFSTIVSLLVVPNLYAWLDDLNAWRRRVAQLSRIDHPSTPAAATTDARVQDSSAR